MKPLVLSLFLFLTIAVSAQDSGFVAARQANLRGTPSEKGSIVARLKYKAPLDIIKQSGDWLLVQAKDYVGWLHRSTVAVRIADTPNPNSLFAAPAMPTDAEIKVKVEDGIKELGIRGITVAVINGEVTLTGGVEKDRFAEVMKAVMEADDSIRKVNNKLTLKPIDFTR